MLQKLFELKVSTWSLLFVRKAFDNLFQSLFVFPLNGMLLLFFHFDVVILTTLRVKERNLKACLSWRKLSMALCLQVKEGKRLKEFLEDYDDDRDDPKYYRWATLKILSLLSPSRVSVINWCTCINVKTLHLICSLNLADLWWLWCFQNSYN